MVPGADYGMKRTRLKIYFGFTMAGDRSSLAAARAIVRVLEEQGHHVLTRHLVDDEARQADRALGPRSVYQRDMQWLDECDAFVAEVSGSSFGLGYEAAFVLAGSQRPVVLCYRREAEPRISFLITGNTHPRCTVRPYDDVAEVEAWLRGGALGATPLAAARPT